MTDSMLEKVARAIEGEFAARQEGAWLNPHQVARAAIEAMMEPTNFMLAEGVANDGVCGSTRNSRDIYRAMIRAALDAPS